MNKTILNVLTFCKVYLQFVNNYHRVVTQQALLHPINAYDQTWDGNLKELIFGYFKVHRVDSHCLLLCWDWAWNICIFLWLYKSTPIWFEEDFLGDIYGCINSVSGLLMICILNGIEKYVIVGNLTITYHFLLFLLSFEVWYLLKIPYTISHWWQYKL